VRYWSLRLGFGLERLCAQLIGGRLSRLFHILIVTPVIFAWLRERELRKVNRARQSPSADSQ
jgi:Cu(I)/Ag(I) efflux system membrane protein CusA/SilA